MPINYAVVTEIGYKAYHINEFGLSSAYLIVGRDRALLIDSGSGFCDLRALVDRLTSLPCDLALTHGHVGHAGGMGRFDSAYIHPEDRDLSLSIDGKARVDFARRRRGSPDESLWGYSPDDASELEIATETRALCEGTSFDLGGRRVTALHTPGHTAGSCSFIDDHSRILFAGDSCGSRLFATECPLSTLLRGLFGIRRRMGDFDRIFGGHTSYEAPDRTLGTKKEALIDGIAACRFVLEANAVPARDLPAVKGPGPQTVEVGAVTLTYDPARLWAPDEPRCPIPMGI